MNAQSKFDRDMKEFEVNLGFDLEDVTNEIQNILSDYDKKIMSRLAFLDEQAKIARTIGVAKSTIADTPFYLRGY